MDGRLTENDVPHNLGQALAKHALEMAPPEQDLDDFPSEAQMKHAIISDEDREMTQSFYRQRKTEVDAYIGELRVSNKVATEHELKAIDRKRFDCPCQIGIDVIALLQCVDPDFTNNEVWYGKEVLTNGPQGRDPVDADLLESSPPFHRTPRFPKVVIGTVYNGSINGLVPFVVGEGDDGHYVEWAANQWTTDYGARTCCQECLS